MSRPEGAGLRPAFVAGGAERYRQQAERSRIMADKAQSPAERREWLDLACHWDALAELLEQLAARPRERRPRP